MEHDDALKVRRGLVFNVDGVMLWMASLGSQPFEPAEM
jgi:hypothetical protein